MGYAFVLAWRQLVRQRLRFAVALGGVAFAVILILMQLGFQDALFGSATRLHGLLLADLVVVHRDTHSLSVVQPFPRTTVFQAAGFPGVRGVGWIYFANGNWKNPIDHTSRNMLLMAFDPDDEVVDIPELNAARGRLKQRENVLFDALSRPEFGPVAELVRGGQTVRTEIGPRQVQVAGLFDFGATFMADGNVVMSDDDFVRVTGRPKEMVQIGLVRLQPGSDPEQVRSALTAALPPNVLVLTRLEFVEKEREFWRKNTAIGFIFGFGVLMGLVVGGVIVYQVLYADVADHLAEYATLKAMGFTNAFLSAVVLGEALVLSVVGFIPGTAASVGLYALCARSTHMAMHLGAGEAVYVFTLTLVMCAVSGVLALRKVQSADPADVF
jgi:putative ABC transport system permease protein